MTSEGVYLRRTRNALYNAIQQVNRVLIRVSALGDPEDVSDVFQEIVDLLHDTTDVYDALLDGKLLPADLARGIGTLSDDLSGGG